MSLPGQILVATAIATTVVAGASSAPERVRSLGPGDLQTLWRLSPDEVRELSVRIDTATELQLALAQLGLLPEHADLSAGLALALDRLRTADAPAAPPVSLAQVVRLRRAAHQAHRAEVAARDARRALASALAGL